MPSLKIRQPESGTLDLVSLMPDASEVWLEIGFGGGEHTVGQARRHPDKLILGSEVFYEGLAKCLGQIEEHAITNIRIWDDDARLLIDRLQPSSIDRVFILFPDPWPKARHHKRRLIQDEFLDALARVLKPGCEVRFATDVRHYADEAFCRFVGHAAFDWAARGPDDWACPPADHIRTRYESKNIGDIPPVYYSFRRRQENVV